MSKQIPSPVKCRQVTLDEQGLVRELLEKHKDSIIPLDEQLYTNASLCTGFSNVLIETVVEKLLCVKYLTSLMSCRIYLFNIRHGQEILRIADKVFGDFDLYHFLEVYKGTLRP